MNAERKRLEASHQTGWTGLVANLIKRNCELKAEESSEDGIR
jgi:hypothetical protein